LPAAVPPPAQPTPPPVQADQSRPRATLPRPRAGFPQIDAGDHQVSFGEAPESHSAWLRRHSSFAISLIANLSLLVALALWNVNQTPESEQILLTSLPDLPAPEQVFEIDKPAELDKDTSEVSSVSGGDLTSLPDAPEIAAITDFRTPRDTPGDIDAIADELLSSDLMQRVGGGQSGGGSGGAGPGFGDGSLMEFVDRLQRAGAKTGDVQISLIWDNFNDLDLHVITPRGENIFFGHRRSRCRGVLDVDMNAGRGTSREPVENVYWGPGKAPLGKYRVLVHHYRNQGDPDPTPFELRVVVDGRTQVIRGETSFGNPRLNMYEFTRTAGNTRPASQAAPSPNDDFPLREK
jgi:hypothetical protein